MAMTAMLYSFATNLQLIETAVDEETEGTTYEVKDLEGDDLNAEGQRFGVVFILSPTGGASSPVVDAEIQTSIDGANWITWASATQVAAGSVGVEYKDSTTIPLLKYVRSVVTPSGGTAPDVTATVALVSNGKFKLIAASA